jgi:hypothetical protein
LSTKTANWLHLQRLRPVDDGRMEDGEFIIVCRTPDDLVILPERVCCAAPHLKLNGTKTIRVRHRRMQPMPTWLEIKRQRFKCRTCDATSYEVLPDIHEDHAMSRALEQEVFLSTIKRPFDDAAVFHQIKKGTARRIFLENSRERLRDYEISLPRVLGVDENHILGTERFVCMDVEGGKVLDMLDGRSVPMLREYFGRMPTGSTSRCSARTCGPAMRPLPLSCSRRPSSSSISSMSSSTRTAPWTMRASISRASSRPRTGAG